jgi:hypothetical protein
MSAFRNCFIVGLIASVAWHNLPSRHGAAPVVQAQATQTTQKDLAGDCRSAALTWVSDGNPTDPIARIMVGSVVGSQVSGNDIQVRTKSPGRSGADMCQAHLIYCTQQSGRVVLDTAQGKHGMEDDGYLPCH